jgi:HAD superfamily hydrolase (TIGR01509 family)
VSEPANQDFIFDVEGTLVDCVPETLACWEAVLKEFGHDRSVQDLQPYSGMDPNDMLEQLVTQASGELRQAIIKRQGDAYRESYLPKARPLPGVRQLFTALKSSGRGIALATTCDREELDHYRKVMEVDDLIDVIACGDDVKHGKPHPDLFELALKRLGRTAAIVVGDTPFDAIAAKRIGSVPVGVLSGGFAKRMLIEAGCVAVYESPEDLLENLSQLFE